jgi:hypothetical protein
VTVSKLFTNVSHVDKLGFGFVYDGDDFRLGWKIIIEEDSLIV